MRVLNRKWKWLVMVAIVSVSVIGSATLFSAGVIYVALLDKYNGESTKASLVLALNTGLLCVVGPFTTSLVNRFSCRVSMVTGGVLLALSGLSSAFVNDLYMLMFTYGIIGGIGNSLTLVPCNIVLCFYFKEYRNLMIALANGSIGLGLFIASPMTIFFLDKYALNGTFLMLGALNAHICIAGFISIPTEVEKVAKYKKNKQRASKEYQIQTYTEQRTNGKCASVCSNFPTFRPSFILFLVSTSCWNLVLSVCLVHLPNYAKINGFNNEEITILMTCFSVSNTVGRFLPVFMVGEKGTIYLVMHILALGIMGILMVTFPLYCQFTWTKFVFSGLVGILTGLPNSLMTLITIVIVGVENISTSHGLAYLSCGGGSLLGPAIAGFLYGQTGSYNNSFVLAGTTSLIGSGISVVAWLNIRGNNPPEEPIRNDDEIVITDNLTNGLL